MVAAAAAATVVITMVCMLLFCQFLLKALYKVVRSDTTNGNDGGKPTDAEPSEAVLW